jgi:hypothetical protein
LSSGLRAGLRLLGGAACGLLGWPLGGLLGGLLGGGDYR